MTESPLVAANVRALLPVVVATLVRRYGDLSGCEDAVQDALADAVQTWPRTGAPEDPRAWLVTVARRRYIDMVRSESARRVREERDAALELRRESSVDSDDSLLLLVLCCHPGLPVASQVALTLRAVCGLTTTRIAAAFYSTESAMTRRITRAKASIDETGRRFPEPSDLDERADAVRTALYLMFNEGYAPRYSALPVHTELVDEAIRLARLLHVATPADHDTTALLGLMLVAAARTPARRADDGAAIALPDQDRRLWDTTMIAEGRGLIGHALSGGTSVLTIEAAIQAVHASAQRADATDWTQILALCDELIRLRPGPAALLGRAVALGMARGALAGLAALADVDRDARLVGDPRLLAARGGLLERAGALREAADCFGRAAEVTDNSAERQWLGHQADRLHARIREGNP